MQVPPQDATLCEEVPGFQWIEEPLGLEHGYQVEAAGCRCEGGDCSLEAGCACCRRNPLGRLYDEEGRLILLVHRTLVEETLTECGPSCSCAGQCANAVTRRPGRARLRLVEVPGKGRGVVSEVALRAGDFVCCYAGEYITTVEAGRRLQRYDEAGGGHALLVVREMLPSGEACLRVNIDATSRGNWGRFFNHSCDGGNLEFITVRHAGSLLPRVAFFASKDIPEGDELTFGYGPPNAGPGSTRCHCGKSECLGWLPHEVV